MNYNPSAQTFVPGQYGAPPVPPRPASRSSTAELSIMAEAAELSQENEGSMYMNSAASEWVPGGAEGFGDFSPTTAAEGAENMVEVAWQGQTFLAPESAVFVAEDGSLQYAGPAGAEVGADLGADLGMQWAQGAYALPAPPKRTLRTVGLPEPIRKHFQDLDIEELRQLPPDSERYRELPARYHCAYPLDKKSAPKDSTAFDAEGMGMGMGAGGAGAAGGQGMSGSSFGYPSSLFKVVDQGDSQAYALRRFDSVRTAPSVVASALSRWQEVRHPGIVTLYSAALERGALFFVYAYHAGAQTLKERFIDQRGQLLAESLIWRLAIQLLSAIRLVHVRGMPVRVVDPQHVLLTSGTCARLSCVAVLDVLEFESRKGAQELMQDDLVKLARLLLSLATRASISSKNTEEALLVLKQNYSLELQRVVSALLSGKHSSAQLCQHPLLAERIHDELDTALAAADALHSHLRAEYENGRVARLLLKLGMVNERPPGPTGDWSETGDQYVLKLFRDYVFHQQDADSGLPVLDAGHVLAALGKLDAGDPEEILLSSRDGKDLLVVSFADVQRCLESSFAELSQLAGSGMGMGMGGGQYQQQTQGYEQYQQMGYDSRGASMVPMTPMLGRGGQQGQQGQGYGYQEGVSAPVAQYGMGMQGGGMQGMQGMQGMGMQGMQGAGMYTGGGAGGGYDTYASGGYTGGRY